VSVVLVAAVSAGCADDVSPAARVGDETITTEELLDEVAEWADNDRSPRAEELAATAAPSGYAITPVGGILAERILLEMLAPAFDDLGLELTDELRDQALQLLGVDPSQADILFEDFSEDYIEGYLDAYAKGIAVQTELGEDAFLDLLRESAKDVEVNPRYGTWDPDQLTVTPPEGPRPAPGSPLTPEL
jgi:hypothetical protein